MEGARDDADADLEFEKSRPAVAMIRKKHIDLSDDFVKAGLREIVQRNSIFDIPRAVINPRFRKECRAVSFHSSWVKSLSCSLDYSPIRIRTETEDDFRMRSVGVTAGNGPAITVFDLELGKKLYEIKEHTSAINSVMISRPPPELCIMPVLVTGSNSGYMKSWDLQSGSFIRTFGIRTIEPGGKKQSPSIHSGPVTVVYVHDNSNSLAFSASACELFVWSLEEGTLIKTLNDHTRPVSAICSYQFNEVVNTVKHPAVMVSGGQDSIIMVYSLGDFAVKYKLDNEAGPVNDIKIPLVSLNDSKERLPVVVAACFDGSVQIWSLGSGQWLSSLHLPHGPVNAICVLPTPVPGLITGHGDGMVLMINFKTHEVLCSLDKYSGIEKKTEGIEDAIGAGSVLDVKEDDVYGMGAAVTSLDYTMYPRPMVVASYTHPKLFIWDLNVGESETATMLQEVLVLDLLWKDPLIAHDSDSED